MSKFIVIIPFSKKIVHFDTRTWLQKSSVNRPLNQWTKWFIKFYTFLYFEWKKHKKQKHVKKHDKQAKNLSKNLNKIEERFSNGATGEYLFNIFYVLIRYNPNKLFEIFHKKKKPDLINTPSKKKKKSSPISF